MKKAVCLLLAAALCLGCALPAAAGNGMIPFEAGLAACFGFSADAWYGAGLYRAMLSLLLTMDFAACEGVPEDIDLATVLTDASFVGKSGDIMSFFGADGSYIVVIAYDTVTGEAGYRLLENTREAREAALTDMMAEFCADGYAANDGGDILSCVEIVNGAMGK